MFLASSLSQSIAVLGSRRWGVVGVPRSLRNLPPVGQVQQRAHLSKTPKIANRASLIKCASKIVPRHGSKFFSSSSRDTRPLRNDPKSQDIPYINNKDFLEALSRYAHQPFVREVLLVWGPKSTGKTEGINIKCDEWRREGRPVVRVDLKGFVGTTETFLTSFYGQVLNALSLNDSDYVIPDATVTLLTRLNDVPGGPSKEEDVFGHAAAQEHRQVDDGKTRLLNDLATQLFCHFSDYYAKVGLFNTKQTVHHMQASQFSNPATASASGSVAPPPRTLRDLLPNWRVGNQLFQVLSSPRVLPGLMIMLEMMAELSPSKTPVVILTEIQNLARNEIGTEGHKMFETLFKSFEVRKQGGSRVPVIAEMSEFLFSELQSSIQAAGESFEPFMLSLCAKEDVREALVPDFISDEQFERLWHTVGGHQGSIYAFFKLMRLGATFEEALTRIKQRAFTEISSVLRSEYIITETERQTVSRLVAHAYASKFEDRIRLIAELRARNWMMTVVRPQEHPSVVYLTMNNILFFDGMHIYPQSKLYQYALDDYLKLIEEQNLFAADQIRSEDSKSIPGP